MEFVPAGTVMRSPESGETTEVLVTPAETGDRYRIRLTLEPGSDSERHVHPGLTEEFSVTSGAVSVRLGRDTSILRVGEQRRVPVRTVHATWNPGDGPAVIDVDLVFDEAGPRPSADLVRFGVAYEEMIRGGHRPGLLGMAVLMDEYADAFALPLPIGLQRLVVRPLAALGRARGHGSAGSGS